MARMEEWACSGCGSSNFLSRCKCRLCGAAKPNPPLWVRCEGKVIATFLQAGRIFPVQECLEQFGLQRLYVHRGGEQVCIGSGVQIEDVLGYTGQHGSRLEPLEVTGPRRGSNNFVRAVLPGASSEEYMTRILNSVYSPVEVTRHSLPGGSSIHVPFWRRIVHETPCSRGNCSCDPRSDIQLPIAAAPDNVNCKHWWYLEMIRMIMEGMVFHGADRSLLRGGIEETIQFPAVRGEQAIKFIPDGIVKKFGFASFAAILASAEGKASGCTRVDFLTAVIQGYDFCSMSLAANSEWNKPWPEGCRRFSLAWSGEHLQLLWMVVENGEPRCYMTKMFTLARHGSNCDLGLEGTLMWNTWIRAMVFESRKTVEAPQMHKGVKGAAFI